MSKHDDLIRVHAPNEPNIGKLLHAWTRAILRYCELHESEDNPWWANERASLSTLAGAAWSMNGWAALEEFSTKKRGAIPANDQGGHDQKNGRCDLYLCTRRTAYVVEAKQAWQSIGANSDGRSKMQKRMLDAWRDAGRLNADEADWRLAATFVIPFVPKTHEKKHGVRELVNGWLDSKPLGPFNRQRVMYAYVFPGKWKDFCNEKTGHVFPGVVLVLQKRTRATRIAKRKTA